MLHLGILNRIFRDMWQISGAFDSMGLDWAGEGEQPDSTNPRECSSPHHMSESRGRLAFFRNSDGNTNPFNPTGLRSTFTKKKV